MSALPFPQSRIPTTTSSVVSPRHGNAESMTSFFGQERRLMSGCAGAVPVKERPCQLLQLAGTAADRSVISHRLWRFYAHAAGDTPEMHRLAATVEPWWDSVEAGITTGYNNARNGGYNRLAKSTKAQCLRLP